MPDFLKLTTELFSGSAVLDGDGLPTKFRILPYGPGSLTLQGQQAGFNFTRQEADTIVANTESRGNTIPMDLEHALAQLADAGGVEEMEMLGSGKITGESPAVGFIKLKAEDDGLWAEVQAWIPRAALLLKEKMYRYFSPVIRGLSDPAKLRISSLALTNKPAFDFQDALWAKSEIGQPKTEGTPAMQAFLKKLLGLLDLKADAVALTAEGPDNRGQGTIFGAIEALKAKAAENPDAVALKTELDALKLTAEKGALAELVATGKREGKLTQALIDGPVAGMDSVALTSFLGALPVNSAVPVVSKLNVGELPEPDAIETSDAVNIRKMFGNPDPNQKKGE